MAGIKLGSVGLGMSVSGPAWRERMRRGCRDFYPASGSIRAVGLQ